MRAALLAREAKPMETFLHVIRALGALASIARLLLELFRRWDRRKHNAEGEGKAKEVTAQAVTSQFVVGDTRFELVTPSVSGKCSPPELIARLRCALFSAGITIPSPALQGKDFFTRFFPHALSYRFATGKSSPNDMFSNVSDINRSSKCVSTYTSNAFRGGILCTRCPAR